MLWYNFILGLKVAFIMSYTKYWPGFQSQSWFNCQRLSLYFTEGSILSWFNCCRLSLYCMEGHDRRCSMIGHGQYIDITDYSISQNYKDDTFDERLMGSQRDWEISDVTDIDVGLGFTQSCFPPKDRNRHFLIDQDGRVHCAARTRSECVALIWLVWDWRYNLIGDRKYWKPFIGPIFDDRLKD